MTSRFKVGDLVYCRLYKKNGFVSRVYENHDCISVKSLDLEDPWSMLYSSNGEIFGVVYLKKVKSFTPKDMLDFANYCISEGFTSNATSRDLVRFLNSRKEVKNDS